MTTIQDLVGRPTCSVTEAADVLSISRSSAYQAAERGEIPTRRIGGRRVVLVMQLLDQLGGPDLVKIWRSGNAA